MNNQISDINNNHGIVTQGQTGNNTIINLAPVPEIKIVTPLAILKRPEGTFDRYFTLEVLASSPPGTLVIAAKGKTVANVVVNPITQGMASTGTWAKDDIHFVRIQNPFGRYQITINTADSESQLLIDFGFNQ